MAQLAEQLICNQQVIGSIPIVGSHGWIPEWPKGADCKSVAERFGGSNPPPSIHNFVMITQDNIITDAGWSSLEARRAHNPKVIGSNPVPATLNLIFFTKVNAQIAQSVEQWTENPRVTGSIPVLGTFSILGI